MRVSLVLEWKGDKLDWSGQHPGNIVHIWVVGSEFLGESQDTCISKLILEMLVTTEPERDEFLVFWEHPTL
jgi:hypothetical protein